MALKTPTPLPRQGRRISIKEMLSISNTPHRGKQHYYQVTLDEEGELIAEPTPSSSDPIYVNMNKPSGVENNAYGLEGTESLPPQLPPINEQQENEPMSSGDLECSNQLYEIYEDDEDTSVSKWSDTVVYIGCLIYLIFLTMFGIVIYLSDGMNILYKNIETNLSSYFNLILSIVLLAFLIFVHSDVYRFLAYVNKSLKSKRNESIKQGQQMRDLSNNKKSKAPEISIIPEHYGFTSGRHEGSGYLKIGALVFYIGHLLHLLLSLAHEIMSNDTPVIDIILSSIKPIISTYILYFAISYSNLIVNRFPVLWKFGLFHCIASSICFWINAIVEETVLAILQSKEKGKKIGYQTNTTVIAQPPTDKSLNIIDKFAPYFFPFTIEFYILTVSVWILMLENLGKVEMNVHKFYSKKPPTEITNPLYTITLDCSHTKIGIFMGLILIVCSILSVILFFTLDDDVGEVILAIFQIILLISSIGVAAWAMKQILTLDLVKQKISMVEDLCLVLCLPSVFLYSSLTVVPHYYNGQWGAVIIDILIGIHPIVQTLLIVIGLRRCSNSSNLQSQMPGRQIIVLLLMCNIAMWIIETFQIKNKEGNAVVINYYGKIMWTLSSHATLPLLLFFYFHSSVCLADIWKSAYQPEHH